jgi:MFS family permease
MPQPHPSPALPDESFPRPLDEAERHDPYAALRVRDFAFFLSGNVLSVIGMQMQSVAVGWEIYRRTGSAMALGWVGFAQVLPVLLLALPAGHVADRVSRKHILMVCMGMLAVVSGGLAFLSATHGPLWAMYACLVLFGVTRAFQQPAKSALVPLIVPRERFANAVTWSTGGFHLASIVGPALAGGMIALTGREMHVYLLDASFAICFLVLLWSIRTPLQEKTDSGLSLEALGVGLRFVYQTKVMFAALTLDMFGVLLGGSTALLPIYAKDILRVDATGFGWMRAMPAIGALLMSFALAHLPPIQKAGRVLLVSVSGFGAATIVFGVSRSYALSLAALFLIGALDNISVVIRHTVVQLLTPDKMRGRVSAVNSMFIGASNELGGFESGLVAHWLGATFSVVSGGVGTLVVVSVVAILFPQLRRYGRLGGPLSDEARQRSVKSTALSHLERDGFVPVEPASAPAAPRRSAPLPGTGSGSA